MMFFLLLGRGFLNWLSAMRDIPVDIRMFFALRHGMVILVVGSCIVRPGFSHGVKIPVGIPAVTVIVNRMVVPVRMVSYPDIETLHPDGIANHPDLAGP